MTRLFLKPIIFLLSSVMFTACDAGFLDGRRDILNGDGILVINGTVSDNSDGTPIEGIRILFEVFQSERANKAILSQTEYTSGKGIYMIRAEGFSGNVYCTITAIDETETYIGSANKINVTWSGTAYDKGSNTFAVNGCNFHLTRR